jgi:LL-diaminopimelate aminotransferase
MIRIEKADRLTRLPPYLFKEIDRLKREVREKGVDIIDLGVGDPDLPTPPHIIEALQRAAENPDHHRYPSYTGMDAFNRCVAGWYKRRFGVELNPVTEVITLIGSKEGIGHIPLAFINPGDAALVTSPAYPVPSAAVGFAGGRVHTLPLLKENGFLPDLDAVPPDVADQAKMMFLNYPNNPTAATANAAFFEKAVAFAEAHNIIVCHDAAYTELCFEDPKPGSFLEVPGAKAVGVEFHSLSKTYCMTGWRIAFAAGSAEVIGGLGQIKGNIDSGVFQAVQEAGIAALEGDQTCVQEMRAVYAERRDVLVAGLRDLGLEVETPRATFYVWAPVPAGYTSADFTGHLLSKAGIVVTPGNGFGEPGEGYVRFALTQSTDRLTQALTRMREVGF